MTADRIYLTDKDIAARLGLSPQKWESIAPVLEREGLPRRDALFDDKRCWPAVLDFLVKRAGVSTLNTTLSVKDGGNYYGFASKARRSNKDQAEKRNSGVVLALPRKGERSRLSTDNGSSL